MTPLFALIAITAVCAALGGGAWLLEETARGRQLTERLIALVLR